MPLRPWPAAWHRTSRSREADVDLRAAGFAAPGNEGRQAMQGLRSEHDIDKGSARNDRCTFLAGNAAADTDDQPWVLLLELAHPAEIVKHSLLSLLAYRAGIEDNDIGLFGVVGLDGAVRGAQHICDLVRIVLIHLTAERADVHLRH